METLLCVYLEWATYSYQHIIERESLLFFKTIRVKSMCKLSLFRQDSPLSHRLVSKGALYL